MDLENQNMVPTKGSWSWRQSTRVSRYTLGWVLILGGFMGCYKQVISRVTIVRTYIR